MKAEYVIGALVALWLADWTRRAYRAAFFQRVCDNCGGTVHGVIGGPDLCFNCKKTAWDVHVLRTGPEDVGRAIREVTR